MHMDYRRGLAERRKCWASEVKTVAIELQSVKPEAVAAGPQNTVHVRENCLG